MIAGAKMIRQLSGYSAALLALVSCAERQDSERSATRSPVTQTHSAVPARVAAAQPDASAARSSAPAQAFEPPAELRLPNGRAQGAKVPLLVLLHGFGVSSALLIWKAGLNSIADSKQFAYLAPQGNSDSQGRPFWNAGTSCCDLDRTGVDDVGRLRALIEANLGNPGIDPARVFVIGYSNGGFMAHRLACEMSDHLAGIISVAGAAPNADVSCAPTTPLSVLEIHGDADPVVHYQGGTVFDRTDQAPHGSALDTARYWATRLACQPAPVDGGRLDIEPYVSERETEVQRFEGCRGAVELWTVHGGAHYVALQPPAIEAMWAFVQAHPKAH